MTPEPILLTDKSRLQEIYDLRVNVWENSEKNEFVNRQLFPNGWFDNLDETAFHWIIVNDQNKIIAATRLNIFDTLEDFPYYEFIKHLTIPDQLPFGFYSRLVVHPEHQGIGLSGRLDTINLLSREDMNFKWWFMFATKDREKILVTKFKYRNIGKSDINYHPQTKSHEVIVFLKHRI